MHKLTFEYHHGNIGGSVDGNIAISWLVKHYNTPHERPVVQIWHDGVMYAQVHNYALNSVKYHAYRNQVKVLVVRTIIKDPMNRWNLEYDKTIERPNALDQSITAKLTISFQDHEVGVLYAMSK